MLNKFNKIISIKPLLTRKLPFLPSFTTIGSIGGKLDAKIDDNCHYFDSTNAEAFDLIRNSMKVLNDFVTDEEEQTLMKEIEPYMKRLRYETSHWDDAIHNYRETERLNWTENNQKIIDRVRSIAFPVGVAPIRTVHILDLAKDGLIKPHIDAIRFCGDTIAGLSLLSSSVMRLAKENDKQVFVDVLLKRRSLYIMSGIARYEFTHEILGQQMSRFKGNPLEKDRRISVICRNEPNSSQSSNS